MAEYHSTDWIPRREAELADLQARWSQTLADAAKQTAFGWPAAECAAVTGAIGAFSAARAVYNADRTKENRITKDDAKEDAVDAMRDFANAHIRPNKLMSPADKEFLGIGPHDTVPTHHERPSSVPQTDARNTENHFEHRVSALNAENEASKPHDAYGVCFAWQVGGERPASGEDLPKSRFNRRPYIVIAHGEACKGKTAYYATCYENSKGDQGEWSPVTEAVIG